MPHPTAATRSTWSCRLGHLTVSAHAVKWSYGLPIDEGDAMTPDDEDGYQEDGPIDYAEMEAEHGRDYVLAEVADSGDPEGIEYLNETDTSCTNEELGRDEDGNREDD